MRLTEIVVSDAYQRFGPVYLPHDVASRVFELEQVARLPKAMIPREAVLSTAVQNYLCEVENGGHNGFIGNLGWSAELLDDIRIGLPLLGLEEEAKIFSDLESYARSDPKRFHASDWTDPVLQGLDERSNPLLKAAHEKHARWLLSLRNVKIVPDADFPSVRRTLIGALQSQSSPNS